MAHDLPDIVEQLAPARSILNLVNEYVRVEELIFYPDDMECSAVFKDDNTSGLSCASELAQSAIMAAWQTLPEEYAITSDVDGRLVIIRLTPAELAARREADAKEAAEAGEPDGAPSRYYFRIEPAAGIHFDDQGKPAAFYGYTDLWFWRNCSAEQRAELIAKERKHIADRCITDPENVIPITQADYLAGITPF